MNIAFVTPRYPDGTAGGGERSVQLLATHLADADRVTNVTVFSFDGQGNSTNGNVDIRRLGSVSSTVTEYQNVRAGIKLRNRLALFDVVHGYNMELHPVIGYLSSKLRIPAVATLNSYHFFPAEVSNRTPRGMERVYEIIGYPITGRVLRRYIKKINVLIALSDATERIYRENGFQKARIERVPNMADPRFSVPNSVPVEEERYSLLYVGTLTQNKGVEYLVRAMELLPEDIDLRVVGSGPQEVELRSLASSLEVESQVEFMGRVPYEELGSYYAQADLFVHPGIWPEPFNRTTLEAMQAALPIVCTDIGGPKEAIEEDRLICEPRDPTALAEAIKYARNTNEPLGKRNRQYVKQNHTPEVVIPILIELYEDLISSHG